MGFNVRIEFTGLCSFVPRDTTKGGGLAFCVILGNAWYDNLCSELPKTGLDGISQLQPHRALLTFPADRLKGAGSLSNITALHFLEGERILVIPGSDAPPQCQIGDVGGLASFTDTTSSKSYGLLSVSDAVLKPDRCVVGAQVIVEHGSVTSPEGNVSWVFDNYLSLERPKSKRLNPKVVVSLDGIETLTLRVKDLASNANIQDLVFDSADDSSELRIAISNVCLNDPLRWGPTPSFEELIDDDDFRWHYEIVDKPEGIKDALNGLPCPIPRLDPTSPNGNGFDCNGKIFPPTEFDPSVWLK
jgi:hypothetical protein